MLLALPTWRGQSTGAFPPSFNLVHGQAQSHARSPEVEICMEWPEWHSWRFLHIFTYPFFPPLRRFQKSMRSRAFFLTFALFFRSVGEGRNSAKDFSSLSTHIQFVSGSTKSLLLSSHQFMICCPVNTHDHIGLRNRQLSATLPSWHGMKRGKPIKRLGS